MKPGHIAVEIGANLGYHSLGMAEAVGPTGENEKRISIICVKLDDVFVTLPKIDFLRMDIEGSELPALRGAFDLVCRSPDLVIVTEWAPPKMARFGSVHDLIDRLTLYGFHAWLIDRSSGEFKPEQMRALLGVDQAAVVLCRRDTL